MNWGRGTIVAIHPCILILIYSVPFSVQTGKAQFPRWAAKPLGMPWGTHLEHLWVVACNNTSWSLLEMHSTQIRPFSYTILVSRLLQNLLEVLKHLHLFSRGKRKSLQWARSNFFLSLFSSLLKNCLPPLSPHTLLYLNSTLMFPLLSHPPRMSRFTFLSSWI